MPATEETYRRQPTLHLVFAISSIAMLLSTVWMVLADHIRPWKEVQREFQQVERDKLEVHGTSKDPRAKDEISGARSTRSMPRSKRPTTAPRNERPRSMSSIESSADWAAPPSSSIPRRRFQKADLDSKRSLYDGMVDRGEEGKAAGLPVNQRRRR